ITTNAAAASVGGKPGRRIIQPQMHTDRSARFKVFVQLRTTECAAGGWFRSVHLCASVCICVYLWLKSLASLVRYGVGGANFGPPPSNPTASACNRLRDNRKNILLTVLGDDATHGTQT